MRLQKPPLESLVVVATICGSIITIRHREHIQSRIAILSNIPWRFVVYNYRRVNIRKLSKSEARMSIENHYSVGLGKIVEIIVNTRDKLLAALANFWPVFGDVLVKRLQ